MERLNEIKRKIAEPGGNFGIGCINPLENNFSSVNRFATHSYEDLAKIQKKENRYRKLIGMKPNKKPINNTENGYKPEISPRILR